MPFTGVVLSRGRRISATTATLRYAQGDQTPGAPPCHLATWFPPGSRPFPLLCPLQRIKRDCLCLRTGPCKVLASPRVVLRAPLPRVNRAGHVSHSCP